MTTFVYRDGWKMKDIEVKADEVQFLPGYVVFYVLGRVTLAVAEPYVSRLWIKGDE